MQSIKFELLKVGHCNHSECIAMGKGGLGSIVFPSLCGLMQHPEHGYILYDTGYSQEFHKVTKPFPECLYSYATPVILTPEEELHKQLEVRNIQINEISNIIISHFHADHIAGLKNFPKSRFFSTEKEYKKIKNWTRWKRLFRAFLLDLIPNDFEERTVFVETLATTISDVRFKEFTEYYDLLGDHSIIGINLPGHTESQLGIYFQDHKDREIFLVGDACWGVDALKENTTPMAIARTIFDDQKEYDTTFQKLRNLYFNENSPWIIPSHCHKTWSKYFQNETVFK